jgi:hypothetical protein
MAVRNLIDFVLLNLGLDHFKDHLFAVLKDLAQGHVNLNLLEGGLFFTNFLDAHEALQQGGVPEWKGDIFKVGEHFGETGVFRLPLYILRNTNLFKNRLDHDLKYLKVASMKTFFLVVELVENYLEV